MLARRVSNGIAEAINKANEGDNILIKTGIYLSNVLIDKDISITGMGRPIIKAKDESEPILAIINSKVSIESVELMGGTIGIYAVGNSKVEINNCIIRDAKYSAIFAKDTSFVTGRNNKLENNGCNLCGNVDPSLRMASFPSFKEKVSSPSSSWNDLQEAIDALVQGGVVLLGGGEYLAGLSIGRDTVIIASPGERVVLVPRQSKSVILSVLPGARVSLKGVYLKGGVEGLSIADNAEVNMEDCVVYDCGIGLSFIGRSHGKIDSCEIRDNREGIHASGKAHIIVLNSTIVRNRYNGLSACEDSHIEGSRTKVEENGCAMLGHVDPTLRLIEKGIVSESVEVFPSTKYQTLQEAVDRLPPDGTLVLDEGHYIGGLTVWKPITIEGKSKSGSILDCSKSVMGAITSLERSKYMSSIECSVVHHYPTTITRPGTLPVISVVPGGELRLKNITLYGGDRGLIVASRASVVLENCAVVSCRRGIELLGTAKLQATHSTIQRSQETGLLARDTSKAMFAKTQFRLNTFFDVFGKEEACLQFTKCDFRRGQNQGFLGGIYLDDTTTGAFHGCNLPLLSVSPTAKLKGTRNFILCRSNVKLPRGFIYPRLGRWIWKLYSVVRRGIVICSL